VFDDGHGCWAKVARCYPRGTPASCIPEPCYSEQSLGCGQ
jgi:hypothetical protein